MIPFALALLLAACVNEFGWEFLPAGFGMQGYFRYVTQWPLLCIAMFGLHALARHRFVSAVCMAVTVMSSTTALCGAWWFGAYFGLLTPLTHCSKALGVPLTLVSAASALLVFWRWPYVRKR